MQRKCHVRETLRFSTGRKQADEYCGTVELHPSVYVRIQLWRNVCVLLRPFSIFKPFTSCDCNNERSGPSIISSNSLTIKDKVRWSGDTEEDSGKVSHYLQEKGEEKKKEGKIRNRPITKYIIHIVAPTVETLWAASRRKGLHCSIIKQERRRSKE